MSAKKRVLLYANCQGVWLADKLRKLESIAPQFDIIYLANFGETPANHPIRRPDFLASCDCLIWQTAAGCQPPELVRAVPAQCRQIRFPTLCLKHLWPLHMNDPRNKPEPGFPYGPYPYGDRLVLRLLDEGVAPADIPKRYIETDLNSIVNLDRFAEMSLAELRFNDQQSDIAITPFIERTMRWRKLFGTVNHPTLLPLYFLLRSLIDVLLERPASDAALEPPDGSVVFGGTEVPLHPQIISHFRLAWAAPDLRWRHNSAFFTLEEYLQAYAAFTPIPCVDTPELWLAQARQAMQRKQPDEAARLLLEGANKFPSNADFLLMLGVLHASRGNLQEAERVLRYALSRHSPNAALCHELGVVLWKRRFPDAASAMFNEALRLDPAHSAARQHLAALQQALAAARRSVASAVA
ncbi:MAG: tetratricopeptide repeat protein [Opitutae bacterium]|nr:tetratricopeptide repeat protein [Opitutae bacterium]